jgi:hypothetical protein
MVHTHVKDITTYVPAPADYNPNNLYTTLEPILAKYNHLYELDINGNLVHTKIAASTLQLREHPTLKLACPAYCLVKYHKPPAEPPTIPPTYPGRPIMSAVLTATYHTSSFLAKVFLPIVKSLKSICLSSSEVIHHATTARFPPNSRILCADVKSLYPSIPIDFGLAAVRAVTYKHWHFTPLELNFYMELFAWVLNNNYCMFNGMIYQQIRGTAMGTPAAVVYANLVLFSMEERIQYPLTCPYYSRFIDDLFGIATLETANLIVSSFNAINDDIQLDSLSVTTLRTGVFLDLNATLVEHPDGYDTLDLSLYQKPLNKYQYIPPLSAHKSHIFHNWVLNELIRYRLSCTLDSDFNALLILFRERLYKRGYPHKILDLALTKLPTRPTLLLKLAHRIDPPLPDPNQPHPSRKFKPCVVTFPLTNLLPTIDFKSICAIPECIYNSAAYRYVYGTKNIVIGTKNSPKILNLVQSSTFINR